MKCESANCDKVANFQCPTCLKLGISGSYFCSQECFKGYWKQHKVIHAMLEKSTTVANSTEIAWPSFSFTGPLRPHKQSPKREVPPHIARPDYADHEKGIPLSEREAKAATTIFVLNEEEIEAMRLVGKLSREILEEGVKAIEVGVTTDEIDRIVHEASIERECYPSPLNYYTFPKSCCTSINEVICHGIPDMRPLCNGDIVNLDVTAYHRGFHGDLNETVFVGEVDEASKKLVQATYDCLSKAIAMVSPGVKYRDVGDVITQTASKYGFSVVRTYCGHGIHRLFHCPPNVPHYSKNKAVGVMKPGHCFTIEPMINAGQWRDKTWLDNWTATTVDGQRSAQFEETLLVTDTGVEVLTRRTTGGGRPYFMDQLERMK